MKIRTLAQAIGHIVSSLPGLKHGGLYYRNLEMDKAAIVALKTSKGDFQSKMTKSTNGVAELKWWISNIDTSFDTIRCLPIDITLYSDASLQE